MRSISAGATEPPTRKSARFPTPEFFFFSRVPSHFTLFHTRLVPRAVRTISHHFSKKKKKKRKRGSFTTRRRQRNLRVVRAREREATLHIRGWQCARFSKFPQELVLRLDHPARIHQIQLLSHEYKIATKIELYTGLLPPGETSLDRAVMRRLAGTSTSTHSFFLALDLRLKFGTDAVRAARHWR